MAATCHKMGNVTPVAILVLAGTVTERPADVAYCPIADLLSSPATDFPVAPIALDSRFRAKER